MVKMLRMILVEDDKDRNVPRREKSYHQKEQEK